MWYIAIIIQKISKWMKKDISIELFYHQLQQKKQAVKNIIRKGSMKEMKIIRNLYWNSYITAITKIKSLVL